MNHLCKTSDEVRRFGRRIITQYGENEPSYEAAAQDMLYEIYHEFVDDQQAPLFALLRTFRLCQHANLPPEARRTLLPSWGEHWLALVATIGQDAAWNDREKSEHHGVIPAGDFSSPMLKAAFEQINLEPGESKASIPASEHMVMLQEAISPIHYFYVEKALDNPYIVEQDDFVKPYGIQSVLGIGCPFVSGSFHMTLFFSKVPLENSDVRLLMQLAPFISALLATYDEKGILWNRV
jgi:hypothetical protein